MHVYVSSSSTLYKYMQVCFIIDIVVSTSVRDCIDNYICASSVCIICQYITIAIVILLICVIVTSDPLLDSVIFSSLSPLLVKQGRNKYVVVKRSFRMGVLNEIKSNQVATLVDANNLMTVENQIGLCVDNAESKNDGIDPALYPNKSAT